MTRLWLEMFGPFKATLEDEPLTDFRTRKVQALLVYLATETQAHPRERLLDLLWPGLPERSARSNLRQILYYMRQAIPEVTGEGETNVPVLVATRREIALNLQAGIEADTNLFEALLAKSQAHAHLDLHLCQECHGNLERAVALYRGDFLADFYLDDSNEFEEWAQARREYFRRKALDTLSILTTIARRQQDYSKAQAYAERQLEIDNLREGGYRQLMEVLALSGRLEQAAAVYETCRRVLAAELGMAPTTRTTELYKKIVTGDLDQDSSPPPGVRGFELKEQIGEGSHGTIHRAIQPGIGREVAVKVIRRKYANDPEFIRRFEAEAQVVARLEHPYIVPLYDYWRDPDGAYLVMRYMRHGSLLSALESGPWEPEQAADLLSQVAAALAVVHRQGVVHRDIKPGNILLDEAGNAYLSDFGIAKDLYRQEQITVHGGLVGTLDYTSPEQIMNEPVTPQTDIYSLGTVLYETLTGEKPFGDVPIATLLNNHLHTPIPPVTAALPGINIEVDNVLQKATAKQPAERYVNVLEMAEAFRRAVRRGQPKVEERAGATIPTLAEIYNPYKGLRAFQEADADDFFGREDLVQRLLDRLGAPANGRESRFLAVVGPSGSGKSSAVKAGLIPALRAGALPGSDKWYIAEMVPGTQPLEELELALWPVAVDPPPSLLEPMAHDTRGVLRTIRRILPDVPDTRLSPAGAQLLLVIDQFEELFTLVEDQEQRAFFLDSLLAAIKAPRSPLRVVITLRADFYDRPLQHPEWGQLLKENTEIVLPLNHAELTWAIREPARRMGVGFEEGLTALIVSDVAEQPGALPLLQYAMAELFEHREDHEITQRAYEGLGGVRGALGQRAEALYAGLAEPSREAGRQLFLRLVTLGEGIEDTRRRVLRSELEAMGAADPAGDAGPSPVDEVLDCFAAARLLTFDRDPLTRAPTVEVAHEALLREWPRLRRWLDESRADVRLQRLLAGAATEWLAAHEDPGFLLRGSRLDQFEGWAEQAGVLLTVSEQSFLEASLQARQQRRDEEETRRRRELEVERERAEVEARAAKRLRQFVLGLAFLLLIALGATWFAVVQSNIAQQNFVASERIRLASQAQLALDRGEEATVPALLALRSLASGYSPEADAALLTALRRGFSRQQYVGHTDFVDLGAFSPDGRFIVTSSIDGTLRQWETQSGQELRQFPGHQGLVQFALSPDGSMILSCGADGTARLWDIESGAELGRFPKIDPFCLVDISPDNRYALTTDGPILYLWDLASGEEVRQFVGQNAIGWVAFSPDSRTIAQAPANGNVVQLWDVESGEELRQFVGHSESLNYVTFSSDSRYLLTASNDETARIWDVESGRELQRLVGHRDGLLTAEFSPDGRLIATAGFDNTVRLWDPRTGRELRQIQGHTGTASAFFSPDASLLLTTSEDRTSRLWDVEIETEPQVYRDFVGFHTTFQRGSAISQDGQFVLTDEGFGVLRLWNVQSSELLRQIPLQGVASNSLAFSPDASSALVASSEGTAYLLDLRSDQAVVPIGNHSGNVWAAVFSPDGRMALTAGDDGAVRLWDVATGAELRAFTGHDGPVRSLSFSSDGHYIISGGEDQAIILWQVDSGAEIRRFTGQFGTVRALAFAPDNQTFVSGHDDNSAVLWDVGQGDVLQRFTGHADDVSLVAFSPDGQSVLTGSTDLTARLWSAATGQALRQYAGHESQLLAAAFSEDGRQLYTADRGNVYVWRTMLEGVIAFACQQLARDFTGEEREFYNITDNEPTCPQFRQEVAQAEPTWTPVAPHSIEAVPLSFVVEMEFVNAELANVGMDVPVQQVFVTDGAEGIVRPENLASDILDMPLFASTEVVTGDMELPFDLGPFPMGDPIGVTLRQYTAAGGDGTYTVMGRRARLDLRFHDLVPDGVYTLWCVELAYPSFETLAELPCGALDGSENTFITDARGNGAISLEIDAFPPSTDETIYSIGVAYHSDGKTYGESPGEFGKNVHVQLFYDFLPPSEE